MYCDILVKLVVYRPGASSGILLGAVSLPGVLFSRLIQLSRAVSVNEVGVEGNLKNVLLLNRCESCEFWVLILLIIWYSFFDAGGNNCDERG